MDNSLIICHSANRFRPVCKRPSSGNWPEPTTTPKPFGNCPKSFNEFEGYCFKIVDEKLPWIEARAACKQYNSDFDLASIQNMREQSFLMTLLLEDVEDDYMFIGFSDIAQEEYFFWIDRTEFDFTYWAPGQPNYEPDVRQ